MYLLGGILSALVDIGGMQLLILAKMQPIAATSCGFALGLLVNYAFHFNITFKNPKQNGSFVRYLCVVLMNYLLTISLVQLTIMLAINPLYGKIISLPLVAINGYILGRLWIFK
jgi:putative flippase GtrA